MKVDSKNWEAFDKYLWHPYTPDPHLGTKRLLVGAKGSYVQDSTGHRVLDGTASWWCNIHGHGHPALVEAIYRQAQELDHVLMAPHSHPRAIELAARLCEKLGAPFEKVFFSDDGSTAVEAAVKMAVQYWHNQGVRGRNRTITLEHAYHGDTLGAVGLSHVDQFHHYFEGMVRPSIKVALPSTAYKTAEQVDALEQRSLSDVKLLLEESHQSVAALVVEPLLLGAGGMHLYRASYLSQLVKLCRQYEVLVIFDEVFTGFGRTGKFWAMQALDVRPDIVCLSKGLTAGMLPLGATVTSQSVYEKFIGGPNKTFYNGHTFSGNPIGCALALASLDLFEQGSAPNVEVMRLFHSQIGRFSELEVVGDVRHLGMVFVVELSRSKASSEPWAPANGPGWSIAQSLWDKGFWLRPLNNLLYLVPPYSMTEGEVGAFLDAIYAELKEQKHFKPFEG